jgi:RNA polymerase-binding transcription factor DksA
MTEQEIQYFKEKLEAEKLLLEKELKSVGRRNPNNPADWEATGTTIDADNADTNEVADTIEEYESNAAILKNLEIRYNEILDALRKIEENTYGVCEVSGEPIEKERLEANPAARTSLAHIGEEANL